jgi:thioredoxin 1
MQDNPHITILDDASLQKEVFESAQPVFVEINASWCGSCHIMAPVIERMARQFADKIKICQVDIDTNENLAREYGVSELPILLFFNKGIIKDHIIGPVSAVELESRLEKLLE